jgi:uncharacterized protein YndB with AHSA1/START domain
MMSRISLIYDLNHLGYIYLYLKILILSSYMDSKEKTITVEALVHSPINTVWAKWTSPADITKWYAASDDWHAPKAENDLKKGGKFLTRMEAKDGSFGFDFEGIYSNVITNELIEYGLGDGRQVKITFQAQGDQTLVTEIFAPENENPHEMQKTGWQAILNNFKKYVESDK